MDDLTYTLLTLCRRNRDGSHSTQAGRRTMLAMISGQLRELGFRRMRASSLKEKHVKALIGRWKAEEIAAGTIKNRVACLRWWAEKIGNAGVIPAENIALAIPNRRFVTNDNKARQLAGNLERVSDPCARRSLQLQEAFGLRREESIKFRPSYADRGEHIVLKGPWPKEVGCVPCLLRGPSSASCLTKRINWSARDR